MSMVHKRLLADLKRIDNENDDGITAMPNENNLFVWTATIDGPYCTPWYGGVFKLYLVFTEYYPFKAPIVVFKSIMFHPNIYPDGRICLDLLGKQWSSIFDVWAILTSIRTLLANPNTNSPANATASNVFENNKSEYERRVQQVVEKSLQDC